MPSRGTLAWTLSACALVAGCNALLGNSDHDVATEDASTSIASIDAGALGVPGPSQADSGVGGGDAQGQGADAQGATPDGGSDTGAGDGGGVAQIAFVQVASRDTKSSVATVSATYPNAQHAGDLNVVVVGWSDPAHTVSSISDSAGSSYVLAAAPTSTTGVVLAVYYAANVAAAGSNTVTVDLDAADFLCVSILEYSGVSQVDQTAVGTGSGLLASTATVVTSLPHELVLGVGEPDQNGTANFASAGAGFSERVITGVSGMLVEDTIASQTGAFAATGGLSSLSSWAMQVVTFK